MTVGQPKTLFPLLDRVAGPGDLRTLPRRDLRRLADEVRADLINSVSETGGHFGAGLGVVELTLALHYVFDTPRDRLIWDVSHQAYPHKILTGRRTSLRSIRQGGGLSGFTRRSESEYDPFGAAHSSTSISAGLGMAVGRDLTDGGNRVIAVIGDGAMSAGLAFEAINNAGAQGRRLIVVLNDNDMSIAPAEGALNAHLNRLAAEKTGGGSIFSALGFTYVGPVDGHDLEALLDTFELVRDAEGPVLVHVRTQKGRGYAPAEAAADKGHAVGRFDAATGKQFPKPAAAPSYTSVFAQSLIAEAEADPRIVAITAAMPSGTGLDKFARKFPGRCFDVGIAEQHAVTFAAGMACEGLKPFAAIYSTFLQRAYDQVVHDVAIQKLPVRFALDRAGLVGADGCTHAGSFDLAYLCCLPNLVVMAPSDEAELAHMVATAAAYDAGPIAFRYPRGEGLGVNVPGRGHPLDIGKGRIVREGSDVALVSLGTRLQPALQAAMMLEAEGISCTVADARFAKPLDEALLSQLARHHAALVTLEEGAAGGFGAHVLQFLAQTDLLRGIAVRTLTLPDRFQEHDTMDRQYAEAGLDAAGIRRCVTSIVPARSLAMAP